MSIPVTPADGLDTEVAHELAFEMWKILRLSHHRESTTLNGDLALFKLCLATVLGLEVAEN